MKKIFEWMREQFKEDIQWNGTHGANKDFSRGIAVEATRGFCLVDEAEAKWEAECCEWKSVSCDNWKPSCETNSTYNVFGVAWFRRCPYCGKPIKIVEVE